MEKLNTKWIATVASIWIQCTSGSSYTFGIYSSALKSTQDYDQSTLDTVSVFKDIGANAGILSGLLYSSSVTFSHHRCLRGPWVVHLAGAFLCFVGYFLMWASVVGLIDRPPVALMCLFMFMAAHAQTFFNTANVVTGVRNFGDYGGTIVGILKLTILETMESLNSKWIATVAGIWIQCSSGATYTFGIYSPTLKSTQNYDQSTLNTVSVFKDIGGNAGILSGLLYSFVTLNHHHRRDNDQYRGLLRSFCGPWVVHLAGAILCFVGYFFMWAAVVGLIDRPPVVLMCLFMFMAAQAQTFFNTANVVTGVKNFGDYGGTIVGILKGYLGLSGAVLIQVYDTIFKGNPSTFLLILALLPTFVSLLLMFLARIYETNAVDDKKHLNAFSAIALTVAAYLMIIIILENIFTLPSWARIITFIFLLLLLASPLGIAYKAQREDTKRLAFSQTLSTEQRISLVYNSEPVQDHHLAYHELPAGDDHKEDLKNIHEDQEDMNIQQAMCTANFWLFIAMICGMGSGLATLNNISQVGESLGYTTIEINSLVSLLSIWNFLGRFGARYVSDIFLHERGWARPLFIAITQATLSIGHIIVGSGFPGNLYVGSIIVGICYGSQWSLMPTITSEIFGVGHMGTIYNTIGIASPVGSYIFSVRIIGYIYDKMASVGEDNSCSGT